MNSSDPQTQLTRFERFAVCVMGGVTVLIALSALLAWDFGQWALTAYNPNLVPMAPGTALAYALLGCALLLRVCLRVMPKRMPVIVVVLVATSALVALLDAFRATHGWSLPWDYIFKPVGQRLGGLPIGYMSPVTAAMFLLASMSLISSVVIKGPRRKIYMSVGAVINLLTALVVILDYASGASLIYRNIPIPMAFLTAIALLPLGMGLLIASGMLHRVMQPDLPEAVLGMEYRIISRRYLLITIGILIAICFAGYGYVQNERVIARGEAYQNLDTVATLKAQQIAQWRKERMGEVQVIRQGVTLAHAIASMLSDPSDAVARGVVIDLLDNVRRGYAYDAVLVYDAAGRLAFSLAGKNPMDVSIKPAEVLVAAQSDQVREISLPGRNPGGTSRQHYAILVPIAAAPSSPSAAIAVIVLVNDPRHFLIPVTSSWPVQSHTAETLVVQNENDEVRFITKPYRPLSLNGAGVPGMASIFPLLRDGNRIVEGVDHRGVPVLATARRIAGTPWVVIAKMDLVEVYGPITAEARLNIVILVMLLLLVVLVATYMWRRRKLQLMALAWQIEKERNELSLRLNGVADRLPGFVYQYLLRPDGSSCFPYASDGIERIYGVTASQVQQDAAPIFEVMHPDDLERVKSGIKESSENLTPWFCEYRVRLAPGNVCWLEGNAMPAREPDGSILWHGYIHDVTDRKTAEEALRRSEQNLNEILAAMPVAVFWKDCNSMYLGCNAHFARDAGLSSDKEIVGLTDHQLAWRNYADAYIADDQSVVASGQARHDISEDLVTSDGREISLLTNKIPLKGADGKVVGILGAYTDVTALKNAERDLRMSEERYRLLFDSSPMPMWLFDTDTLRFIAVNETAVQKYGFTKAEFLESTILSIHAEEDAGVNTKLTAGGRDQLPSMTEVQHRRKDGTVFPAQVYSRPMRYEGRIVRLVIAIDISEKKTLEEQYLRAQRLESLGQLASGIAHDLNNMLAPMLFAAPLLRESVTAERDRKVLDAVEHSAQRGADLVRQILGFVRGASAEKRVT